MLTMDEVQADDCKAFEGTIRIGDFSVEDIVWIFPDADADGDEKVSRDEVVAELAKAGIVLPAPAPSPA